MILGCVLVILGLPGIYEGLFLDGLGGLWDPHTLTLGVLPLVLGAWCLSELKRLKRSGEREDRLHHIEVSHAFGLASGVLLLLLILVAVVIGQEPELDWMGLCFLLSSALTAVVSIAFALAARRSRRQQNSGTSLSTSRWGWILAGSLLVCYSAITSYNVWWGLRFERYQATERILINNGLILELNRLADGRYLSPGFDGTLRSAADSSPRASRLEPLDGWGRPILYSCSADGQHYEMASPGANGSIEARRGSEPMDVGDDLDQDVVFASGVFVRYRWGGWCCPFSLQETSREEMEAWLQRLHPD